MKSISLSEKPEIIILFFDVDLNIKNDKVFYYMLCIDIEDFSIQDNSKSKVLDTIKKFYKICTFVCANGSLCINLCFKLTTLLSVW